MIEGLRFHEILSLGDELYDAFLDLYQISFPLNEQMLVSDHNRVLRGKEEGRSRHQHLLAALDGERVLVGMARYDLIAECRAAVLWYLAVHPDARCKGIGSAFYAEIARRVRLEGPSIRALAFEVQDPEETQSPEERDLAIRRIEFYRRNGAQRLCGIHYTQSVGWQPPVPMHIMVHLWAPTDLEDVFQLSKCLFGNAVQRVKPLSLE